MKKFNRKKPKAIEEQPTMIPPVFDPKELIELPAVSKIVVLELGPSILTAAEIINDRRWALSFLHFHEEGCQVYGVFRFDAEQADRITEEFTRRPIQG